MNNVSKATNNKSSSKQGCSKRISCRIGRKQDRALRDMKRGGKRNLWVTVEA